MVAVVNVLWLVVAYGYNIYRHTVSTPGIYRTPIYILQKAR